MKEKLLSLDNNQNIKKVKDSYNSRNNTNSVSNYHSSFTHISRNHNYVCCVR